VSATANRALTGVLVVAALTLGSPARAQGPEEYPRAHRVEIAAGVAWTGRASLGDGSADLTRNEDPVTPYPIFTTDSTLAAAPGFEGRLGYSVSKALSVEVIFTVARPTLETAVSGDVESAPPVTASEHVSQYTVEGGVVLHLTRWRFGGRAVPFVSGGMGYLRQLHEHRELAETGQVYSVGGGVKYVWVERPVGAVKGLGVRAEARLLVRRGGIDLQPDEASHTSPAVAATVFVHF
jgi:opacity protein-like surface antigen